MSMILPSRFIEEIESVVALAGLGADVERDRGVALARCLEVADPLVDVEIARQRFVSVGGRRGLVLEGNVSSARRGMWCSVRR
jgi:hypothetical protein